jgi:hypothetical protein
MEVTKITERLRRLCLSKRLHTKVLEGNPLNSVAISRLKEINKDIRSLCQECHIEEEA